MAMDELEISKIFGAGCAALLAFVGFGQLGSAVVGVKQLDEPAYVIDIPEVAGGEVEVAEAMPVVQVMAMADMDLGAKVFKKCSSCHKIEDGNAHGLGPDLYGIVGRDIAGADGFAYSDALLEKEGPWDFAALDGFLEAPKKWAKGTKMGFAGLSKPEDRGSVIAWMNEQSDAPLPLPPVEEAAAEAEEPEQTEVAAVEPEAEQPAEVETAEAEQPAEAETAEAEQPAAAETAEAEQPAEAETAEAEQPAETETAKAEQPAETEMAMVEQPAAAETAKSEEPKAAVASAAAAGAGVAAFMVGADIAKGEKVFRKCKACHKVEADAGNGVGPNLHGIVGRDIAALDGFKYSKALSEKDGAWDFETLNAFLIKPKEWAKGTKMSFAGLRKEEDRAAVIAWLNEQSDAPLPLPE